jgi:hypothetical protein
MLSVVMLSVFMQNAIMLSVIMLSVIMLSVIMLSVIMLSVIMLNAVMLSVIMLNAAMLSVIILSAVVPFTVVAIKCLHLQTLLSGLLSTRVFLWQPFLAKFDVYEQGRIPLDWSTFECRKVSSITSKCSYLSEANNLAYFVKVAPTI